MHAHTHTHTRTHTHILAEILKIDPHFSKEEFVQQCQFEIIPTILEVKDSLFLNSDVEY